jgi:hypothetical protein
MCFAYQVGVCVHPLGLAHSRLFSKLGVERRFCLVLIFHVFPRQRVIANTYHEMIYTLLKYFKYMMTYMSASTYSSPI